MPTGDARGSDGMLQGTLTASCVDDCEPGRLERSWLAALDRLETGEFDQDETAHIAATRRRVAEEDLYVVAIGEFKRGKSSLLNALIGRPALPVGVVPLTAVVTVLRRGPARAVAHFEDGSESAVDARDLGRYATEAGNPGNRQGLARVEVALPDLDLPPHVALIDTPGLGSVYETGTDHTLGFLSQLDVALMVLSVDQPLTEAEEKLAGRLRDQGTEVLFVMNKTDYLSRAETDEAVHFVTKRLVQAGYVRPLVFGVSAKTALAGGSAGGIDTLRARLSDLVEHRYDAIHAAQAKRRIAGLLDELETTYAMRAEIAAKGEAELDAALRELDESRSEVARLSEEQDAVFAHRIQTTEHRLSDRMRAFQSELERRLLEAVKVLERPDEEPTERRADELMDAVITPALVETADREMPVLEATLQEGYERLLVGMDELAVTLAERTSEILGVPIVRPRPSERHASAPSVTVKLRDDRVTLELITGALQAPLPQRLRRKIVARRSRERAAELANLHAGRLRSELARGLREATRTALSDAHEEIDAISSSIDKAVERGIAQRRLVGDEAQAARRRIAAALASIRDARALLVDDGHVDAPTRP